MGEDARGPSPDAGPQGRGGDPGRLGALRQRLAAPVDPVVLGVFRIGFGLVMAASAVRFLLLGWAGPLYVEPAFHFTYPGFGWVRPLPLWALHALLGVTVVSALAFAYGRAARAWLAVFVVSFTYVELIDAATYLNHYYFVSAVGVLMLALPMGAALVPGRADRASVPAWTVGALRLQVGLVYVFAGVAKLSTDWLVEAMPLRIWLPARGGLPVVGPLLDLEWMPWAFAWGGALFDLTAPFWLSSRRWRPWAFAAAVAFHAATYALFNIGVFPFVMVAAALVFFEGDEWRALVRSLRLGERRLGERRLGALPEAARPARQPSRWAAGAVGVLLLVQIALPLRHWLYPGDRLWTEEGFRFAWHVMVAEKTGTAEFLVTDPASGRTWTVAPGGDLTPLQEKQMAFQPDLIWQYAQHVERQFQAAGFADVEVRAATYVSVNGRPGAPLVDPEADLTAVPRGLGPKPWVLRDPPPIP
ncbi:MAG: HTTM domain-containing protein [Bacteroidota bacterium]